MIIKDVAPGLDKKKSIVFVSVLYGLSNLITFLYFLLFNVISYNMIFAIIPLVVIPYIYLLVKKVSITNEETHLKVVFERVN